MNNIHLDELLVFAILAEERTFSDAAARLSCADSTVSKKLNSLEDKFGRKLIHRPARPIRLTEAGKIALKAAHNILKIKEEAEREMAKLDDIKTITIMCNPAVAITDLTTAAHKLADEGCKVIFKEGTFKEIRDAVFSGAADIGILASASHSDGLRYFPYRTDRLVALMPLTHPLAWEKTVTIDMLAEHQLISASEARQITTYIHQHAPDVKINSIMEADNFDLQATLIATSRDKAGIMLESIAKRHAAQHRLKIIPLSHHWAKGEFYVCVKDRSSLNESTNALLRLLNCN